MLIAEEPNGYGVIRGQLGDAEMLSDPIVTAVIRADGVNPEESAKARNSIGSGISGRGCRFSFGPFRLIPAERRLLQGGEPVRLGSRAFDVLCVLAERAGSLVAKEELIARAWPTTVVDEGNLKLQVCALRRVLGDGLPGRRYIVTVPGRGYHFAAPVMREETSHAFE